MIRSKNKGFLYFYDQIIKSFSLIKRSFLSGLLGI
ncbi:hypothetical protein HPSH_00415 [Helicobacter pylori Shi470]|nr:hypothetical protein HPSH_00415 [Helicobacter pylori Shi470]